MQDWHRQPTHSRLWKQREMNGIRTHSFFLTQSAVLFFVFFFCFFFRVFVLFFVFLFVFFFELVNSKRKQDNDKNTHVFAVFVTHEFNSRMSLGLAQNRSPSDAAKAVTTCTHASCVGPNPNERPALWRIRPRNDWRWMELSRFSIWASRMADTNASSFPGWSTSRT